MFKKGLKYFFISIGISLGLTWATMIIMMIIGGIFSSVLPICIIVAILAFIIAGVAADSIVEKECDNVYSSWEKNFWLKRYETGRRVTLKRIFFMLLPILVLSLVLFVILMAKYAWLNGAFNREEQMSIRILLAVSLPTISAFGIFFSIMILKRYKHYTCPKCRCVNPWIYESLVKFEGGESEKTKTRDTYGKVGDVYIDGKKAGEVSGRTGTQTITTKYYNTRTVVLCRCQVCNNRKNFEKRESEFRGKYYS